MQNYTNDTSFLMMVFVMPGLFGLSLLGEGINKIMNYDPRGWLGVVSGGLFIVVIVVAFVMIEMGGV
jgi:hypothetical protein